MNSLFLFALILFLAQGVVGRDAALARVIAGVLVAGLVALLVRSVGT